MFLLDSLNICPEVREQILESLRKLVNKKSFAPCPIPPKEQQHPTVKSFTPCILMGCSPVEHALVLTLQCVVVLLWSLYIVKCNWIGLLFSISCLYSCFDTTRIHSFASNMFHSFLLVPSSLLVIYSNTFIVNPCHISMYSSSGVVMEETCRIYICIYKCVCACYIIFFWFLQGTM